MHPKETKDFHSKNEKKTINSTQKLKINHHEDAQLIVDLLSNSNKANNEMKQLMQLLNNPKNTNI